MVGASVEVTTLPFDSVKTTTFGGWVTVSPLELTMVWPPGMEVTMAVVMTEPALLVVTTDLVIGIVAVRVLFVKRAEVIGIEELVTGSVVVFLAVEVVTMIDVTFLLALFDADELEVLTLMDEVMDDATLEAVLEDLIEYVDTIEDTG